MRVGRIAPCLLLLFSLSTAAAQGIFELIDCSVYTAAAECGARAECAWCVLASNETVSNPGVCKPLVSSHAECVVFDTKGCSAFATSTDCYAWEMSKGLGCGWCGSSPTVGRCQPGGQFCNAAWDPYNCLIAATAVQCNATNAKLLCSWCDAAAACQPTAKPCASKAAAAQPVLPVPVDSASDSPAAVATPAQQPAKASGDVHSEEGAVLLTDDPLVAAKQPAHAAAPAAAGTASAKASSAASSATAAADDDDDDDDDENIDKEGNLIAASLPSSVGSAVAAALGGWFTVVMWLVALAVLVVLVRVVMQCVKVHGYERVPDHAMPPDYVTNEDL